LEYGGVIRSEKGFVHRTRTIYKKGDRTIAIIIETYPFLTTYKIISKSCRNM